jgi:hypothetical protein
MNALRGSRIQVAISGVRLQIARSVAAISLANAPAGHEPRPIIAFEHE